MQEFKLDIVSTINNPTYKMYKTLMYDQHK